MRCTGLGLIPIDCDVSSHATETLFSCRKKFNKTPARALLAKVKGNNAAYVYVDIGEEFGAAFAIGREFRERDHAHQNFFAIVLPFADLNTTKARTPNAYHEEVIP